MNQKEYRIEDLPELFSKHASEAQRNHEEALMNYRDSFPDSEPPEWMNNDFNIAAALSVMAKEIVRLKKFEIKKKI